MCVYLQQKPRHSVLTLELLKAEISFAFSEFRMQMHCVTTPQQLRSLSVTFTPRRFQRHFKRLLPVLFDLVTTHRLQVVWKVHEPVTDELIADSSMVRNDLLQEYNALIMEQT